MHTIKRGSCRAEKKSLLMIDEGCLIWGEKAQGKRRARSGSRAGTGLEQKQELGMSKLGAGAEQEQGRNRRRAGAE